MIIQDHRGLFESRQSHPDWRIWGEDVHSVHSHRWHGSLHQANRFVRSPLCAKRVLTNYLTLKCWFLFFFFMTDLPCRSRVWTNTVLLLLGTGGREKDSSQHCLQTHLQVFGPNAVKHSPERFRGLCLCQLPAPFHILTPIKPQRSNSFVIKSHLMPLLSWRVWHLFPLLSPQEELETDLAKTVPIFNLEQDDFVVNVSSVFVFF